MKPFLSHHPPIINQRLSCFTPKNILPLQRPRKHIHHKFSCRAKETHHLNIKENSKSLKELGAFSSSIFSMATSISATGFQGGFGTSFKGSWGASIVGEDYAMLIKSVPNHVGVGKPVKLPPMMKNVNEGKGVFAPIVVITRQAIGKKRFNQLRGKAIALHSQVITEFCRSIGADPKQRQGLIRLAKKNGERLGFLA